MALYHLSVKTISRRVGRSATGAAAYRAGVKITDERTGLVHDYRRRSGVIHQELFTPAEAPVWAQERAALWNAAEQAEARKDATVAREIELSLPHELNPAQRLALARELGQALSGRHGVAVDLAIHAPHRGDPRNHHAHLLFSTRRLSTAGFTEKTREWDNRQPVKGLTGQQVVEHWRQAWEQQANQALERAGHTIRIDHRTLDAQGLERVPQIHQGPQVAALEQRGIRTDRGDQARAIDHGNAQLIGLQAQRRDLEQQQQQEELSEIITAGRAEALKEYAAWKAEQERQALERERAQARREFEQWKQQQAPERQKLKQEHEYEHELSKTQELEPNRDHGLSR